MSLGRRVSRIDLGKQVVSKEQIANQTLLTLDPTGLKQIIKEVTERLMKRPGMRYLFSVRFWGVPRGTQFIPAAVIGPFGPRH